MKVFFLGFLCLFLSAVAGAENAEKAERNFVWKCHALGDDRLEASMEVSAGHWVHRQTAYEDDDCISPYLVFEIKYRALVRGGEADLVVEAVSYRSLSDEVTEALNLIGYCGFNDWRTFQIKEVAGRLCDEFQAPAAGIFVFTVFDLREGAGTAAQFRWGIPGAGAEGDRRETRHQNLGPDVYVEEIPQFLHLFTK